MTPFRLAAFARLAARLARTERELQQMEAYYADHADEVRAGDWGAVSAMSSGIHNVYNGIEDALLSIAKDVDAYVPTGGSAHQDILDQMAADIAGIRPALLDAELYDALFDLKGFRHLVRHKYGIDLKPEKVIENLLRLRTVFPAFMSAVAQLEATLSADGD
ncbi:hypothetical protein SAMN05880582_10766 [Rhizobium sp. RU20A]|uniref:ribonuclease toxin HepT-like protein n=1 Tax=Rhizobium sp. RU20A TaxID=1907412 RepID=UPI0009562734|nr:hypothetical protein [Rhizobium sp. RU20A]SIR15937.1 hypothetical protein SAMN05880582_10766 [Rhizobium sp. RU20A]